MIKKIIRKWDECMKIKKYTQESRVDPDVEG